MTKNRNLLIISTDENNTKALTTFLKPYLFNASPATSGTEALSILQNTNNFDAIILDVLLPDMYGIELCKNIRGYLPNIPIIFLSKVNDPTEIVLCFEAGADDYIEVPYNQHILLARLKAKTRRKTAENTIQEISFANISDIDINDHNHIQFGKWLYQPRKCLVTHPDYGEIYLTDKENTLLKLLLSNPTQTFSREDISQHLNLSGRNSMVRDVNIHIHRLRNKLTQGHNSNSPIKAVRAQGYTLDSYLNYVYDNKEVSCL